TCIDAFGPEGGTAAAIAPAAAPAAAAAVAEAAPAGAGAIAATAGGILAASIITTVRLNPNEPARIEEVLKQCADPAHSEALQERFGGRNPSVGQCMELVGRTSRGEPIYFSMKLGEE